MGIEHKTPLTSAEIGILWNHYLFDSMSLWVEKIHASYEQDQQTQAIILDAVALMEKTTGQIRHMLQNESIPLPIGFTEGDVNFNAPPLYSSIFRLGYVKFKVKLRLLANGLALAVSSRPDVRKFFRDLTIAVLDLDDRATSLLMEKGLYIRAPYISVDDKVDFVQSQTFMGELFGAGERKLLAAEIGILFSNIQNNVMGKTLLTGFSQVAKSPYVREYMKRGMKIANKHIEIFSALLRDEDIPVPISWDSGVTTSTIAPFSDKLMMTHTAILNQVGIANYGIAMAVAMRRDLQVDYVRLAAETGQYATDGANLLIDNTWLEEPPKAVDHQCLQ